MEAAKRSRTASAWAPQRRHLQQEPGLGQHTCALLTRAIPTAIAANASPDPHAPARLKLPRALLATLPTSKGSRRMARHDAELAFLHHLHQPRIWWGGRVFSSIKDTPVAHLQPSCKRPASKPPSAFVKLRALAVKLCRTPSTEGPQLSSDAGS